jgi:hypothetical protein
MPVAEEELLRTFRSPAECRAEATSPHVWMACLPQLARLRPAT